MSRAPARFDLLSTRVEAIEGLGGGAWLLRCVTPDPAGLLAGTEPGQFAMLRPTADAEPLLPRPMSILRVEALPDYLARVSFYIKPVGPGTRRLVQLLPGAELSVLAPLGTGFPPPDPATRDVLVAGGVGLAPLLMYAEHFVNLLTPGCAILYGGRTVADLHLLDDLRATGARLVLTTEDGSAGSRARVTDLLGALLREPGTARVLTCGPRPMLEAVAAIAREAGTRCHAAIEAPMACGFGICLGCVVPVVEGGYVRACVEGPVFDAAQLAALGPAPALDRCGGPA